MLCTHHVLYSYQTEKSRKAHTFRKEADNSSKYKEERSQEINVLENKNFGNIQKTKMMILKTTVVK